MRFFITLLLVTLAFPAYAQNTQKIERQFQTWLKNDLWPEAKRLGVSSRTFNSAFKGVTLNWKLPDLVPPGTKAKPSRPQAQAEFRSPGRYFNENNIAPVVRSGRQLFNKHKALLTRIEKQYGVPGRIILAIWGRESAFGRAKIPHDAVRVVATKAFMSTRKDLFRKETLAALQILQKGYATRGSMKSSWAGAMGQPQFLPSSYLEYAVDYDGDGKRNIWGSVPDTLASIANYLSQYGWQRGRDWGYEAAIPANVSCALEGPDQMRPIRDWAKAGVTRISGKAFPNAELGKNGGVLMPAGRAGPAFIATPNFYVIKKYNNSDLYALFVGNVADRIQYTDKPFVAGFQSVSGLKRGNVMAIQNGLIKKGYDVGGADGLAGFKTRRSIGDWQQKNGLKPTCFPDRGLAGRF
ncbi:MAG: lytic murein transglycosylase [Rhizobiaceae bacterium]|nr:lytic murein transglycosylase [Rhizobiaceae bacterium]